MSYQNKAVKIITKAKWNDSPSPLFSDLGYLNSLNYINLKLQKLCTALTQKSLLLLQLNILKSQVSHILTQVVQLGLLNCISLYLKLYQITKIFPLQGVKI